MGFKSEKVSIKDIMQRELAEIDAFMYENGSVVKYEIALESVPQNFRNYARENQAVYGWEKEDGKIAFVKKEKFIRKFSKDFAENNKVCPGEAGLENDMIRYAAEKNRRFGARFTIALLAVLLCVTSSFAAYLMISSGDSVSSVLTGDTESIKQELAQVTEERDVLLTEKETLLGEKQALQENLTATEEERDALKPDAESWNANKEKIQFYNNNAVIVYGDGTYLYHSYGCSRHGNATPGILDVTRAKNAGYKKCPHCLGN
ncbi:MAG: hypothetical protein IKJ55_00065 [Clostridia bacterium]|nr:hypothetical protein [Clostridia bacterium]